MLSNQPQREVFIADSLSRLPGTGKNPKRICIEWDFSLGKCVGVGINAVMSFVVLPLVLRHLVVGTNAIQSRFLATFLCFDKHATYA